MGIDEYALVTSFGVKPFPLLEKDECRTATEDDDERDQPGKETYQAVGEDEADDASTHSSCRPIDIPSLYPHELKRLLEPFEEGVRDMTAFVYSVQGSSVSYLLYRRTEAGPGLPQ